MVWFMILLALILRGRIDVLNFRNLERINYNAEFKTVKSAIPARILLQKACGAK